MQTITRAEFLAKTQIVRSVSTARVYSDSAVAGDILKRFEVVKIKAHIQDTEAICDWDLYTILGNRFADMSAKAVLTPDNCRSVQLSGFFTKFFFSTVQRAGGLLTMLD